MDADSIRRAFTDFFSQRDHLAVASAPLVAPGDPTLLFTSAGMAPFKPYFSGQERPPRVRLTSIQKCFRTTDIDEVGDDSHLTFFEMLGNFSLGDYFKDEAQAWAWELITEELQVPAERLVTTVFRDDDEAYGIWRKLGVPEQRIFRYGAEQGNYWYSGEDGPCGPCSELHYDLRPDARGPSAGPADDETRFLEIWNLVFMQFQCNSDGSKTPLPAKNIDTGAGLERWAMMLQDKSSLYETDLFAPLLEYVAGRCERDYGTADATERRALRVIVEHGRAMTFLVSDGVLPSNKGRGSVLRRLIRRALYMAQSLGIEEQILAGVAGEVRAQMGTTYPELVEQASLVERVLDQEEERFRQTLDSGHRML
ncbi:MAG: alanine--tRNA ligase-related protein, partial [Dehalococcoidia bacterium]